MTDQTNALATLNDSGQATNAGNITVYNHDFTTGEYKGTTEEYISVGVGIPANSTTIQPPEATSGNAIVFVDGAWTVERDHRGETVYDTDTGNAVEIATIGDYPDNVTTLKPSTDWDKWNGTAWVTDTSAQITAEIATAEAEKSQLISDVNVKTLAWQTQLLLGIITDADKASLTTWMKYYQQLKAVDTSTAPDIIWPDKPAA